MIRGFGKYFLFFLGLASPAGAALARPPVSSDTLQQKLAVIVKAVPDWSGNNPEVFWLWDQQDYLLMYRHPCRYLEPAVELLAGGQLPAKQQEVLPFMLEQLPLGSYLQWMKFAGDAYGKRQVSLQFLRHAAFPSPQDRPDVYFAYKDDKLGGFYRSLAQTLAAGGDDPLHHDLVNQANDAASGKTAAVLLPTLKSLDEAPPRSDLSQTCETLAAPPPVTAPAAATAVPPPPLPPSTPG
jgi:hypothetical protein